VFIEKGLVRVKLPPNASANKVSVAEEIKEYEETWKQEESQMKDEKKAVPEEEEDLIYDKDIPDVPRTLSRRRNGKEKKR
jgi:hypothetical protein